MVVAYYHMNIQQQKLGGVTLNDIQNQDVTKPKFYWLRVLIMKLINILSLLLQKGEQYGIKEKNTSVLCKELKGITTGTVLRSCRGCVEDAAEILEEIVDEKMNI